MKLYLVHSGEPRSEHIDDQIIAANSPEEAFALWEGFYGFPWRCHMNEIPAVAETPQVMKWNPPTRFKPDDALTMKARDAARRR
jgi:hypothetical protein